MTTPQNPRIRIRVEASDDKKYSYCQALIDTQLGTIGDSEAWALTGLVRGAVDDLLRRLARQDDSGSSSRLTELSPQDLFTALESQRASDDDPRESDRDVHDIDNTDDYLAVPQGTELFDGESAFLVKGDTDESRLVWRDHESEDIREVPLSFASYLQEWRAAGARLVSSPATTEPRDEPE